MLALFIYFSWGGLIAAIAFLMCKPNPLTMLIFIDFMLMAFYSVSLL